MKLFLDGPERECERLALEFAATEKQIQAASRRAVSKLGRWMKSAILRESSRDTGMPRKALKGRLKMSVDRVAASTRVWVGRNAIPLSALNPRQTRSGVTAGPVQRRHALCCRGVVVLSLSEKAGHVCRFPCSTRIFPRTLNACCKQRFTPKQSGNFCIYFGRSCAGKK